MIHKFKSFIKNSKAQHSGGLYIYAIIIMYVFIIFSILYGKIYTIIILGMRVKETMKEACIYVMTSNWDELFHSVKEGYAGAYNFEGEELLDADRVYDIMQKELETEKFEGQYVRYGNNLNEVIFKYYDIEMKINNTGFKNIDDSYNIDLKLTFEAPIEILTIKFPIKVDLKNKARWNAKY